MTLSKELFNLSPSSKSCFKGFYVLIHKPGRSFGAIVEKKIWSLSHECQLKDHKTIDDFS